MAITYAQQVQALADYLPSGRAFASKNVSGSVTRQLLTGLANQLFTAAEILEIYRDDTLPDATKFFIDDWERALAIPDGCYPGTGDDIERRMHIIAKLAHSGLQTSQDFVDFGAAFGFTCTAEPGMTLYPATIANIKTARFTIVIRSSQIDNINFPYTFPFEFGLGDGNMVICLFNKLKPATVELLFAQL